MSGLLYARSSLQKADFVSTRLTYLQDQLRNTFKIDIGLVARPCKCYSKDNR
jgi:hypothetical protein